MMQGTLARRMGTVTAILRGEPTDLSGASVALGYPLQRHHTAMVGWVHDDDRPAGLTRAASAFATQVAELFGGQAFYVASGTSGAWGWPATSREPDLSLIMQLGIPPGVSVTVGNTGCGLDGFRRSHKDARATQRLFADGVPGNHPLLYDDVELAILLGTDMEGLRALVKRDLHGLADPSPGTAKIRQTLLAFYTQSQHLGLTPDSLGIHKNTVRYRLQQAQNLLTHPLDQRRAKVEMALHC